MPLGEALAELARNRATQFDPQVVDALLRLLSDTVTPAVESLTGNQSN
jgi:HD-GYP domain-containing protein (c-di-GMP phosphodiesterase class II)